MRLRNFTLSAALAVVAVACTALALEVVLRATHLAGARVAWTEPDDRIGWRFTPGHEYWHFKENDHPISGRINSMGWRDAERTREKPAGTFRIAVIGDSFVEALQVELDSTFCRIAERDLGRRLGRPVEVMNFGRSGTTTSEQLLILESDVLPCAPDLVVLLFVPDNDIGDVAAQTALDPMRPFFFERPDGSLLLDTSFKDTRAFRMRRLINPLKQHSALVSLAATRYNLMRQARRLGNVGDRRGGMPTWLTLCTDSPDSTYAANFALNRRLLSEIASRCERDAVPLILMCGPTAYRADRIARWRRVAPSFEPDAIEASLRSWAGEDGPDFIGLQALFRERYASGGTDLTWSHFNYAGHRVVARALAERVSRHLDI
jgi:hypothetical protein